MPSLNDPMSFLRRMDDPIHQSRSETDDKPVLVQVCAKPKTEIEQVGLRLEIDYKVKM